MILCFSLMIWIILWYLEDTSYVWLARVFIITPGVKFCQNVYEKMVKTKESKISKLECHNIEEKQLNISIPCTSRYLQSRNKYDFLTQNKRNHIANSLNLPYINDAKLFIRDTLSGLINYTLQTLVKFNITTNKSQLKSKVEWQTTI